MRVSVKLKLVFVVTLALYLALSFHSWASLRTTNDDNVPSTLHDFASHSLKVKSSSLSSAMTSTSMTTATSSKPHNPLEDLSSVDFFACCGIGHRLVRMSLAHFVAKQRNFTLRGFWGWCGEKSPVEVFSYLFRPYTADEVAHPPGDTPPGGCVYGSGLPPVLVAVNSTRAWVRLLSARQPLERSDAECPPGGEEVSARPEVLAASAVALWRGC